ncbi:hypothetical protein AB3R30_25540 [Leptolyngbyaceae cyanobacterium UHCC 1019]
MNPKFLDWFLSSSAATPANVPAPKLHLFQQTPVGKIVGIIWDEETQKWLYGRDDGFNVSSEDFYLEALEKEQ